MYTHVDKIYTCSLFITRVTLARHNAAGDDDDSDSDSGRSVAGVAWPETPWPKYWKNSIYGMYNPV